MNSQTRYNWLQYLIASVWLVNGLLCKVLNLVPRHQEIVARILGGNHESLVTKGIGVGEIIIAGLILSRWSPRPVAGAQIGLVLTMNLLEFFLAPDLLLWGRLNLVFAVVFAGLLYYQEFALGHRVSQQQAHG